MGATAGEIIVVIAGVNALKRPRAIKR